MSCAINMWLKCSKIVDRDKERGSYQIYLMAFKTRVSYMSLCRIKNKTSLVVQMVKNLLATQETQLQSLRWEHPLEQGMATHSSTVVLRIFQARILEWAAISFSRGSFQPRDRVLGEYKYGN